MDGDSMGFTLGTATTEELIKELHSRFPVLLFCGVHYPKEKATSFVMDVLSHDDYEEDLHLSYYMLGHQLLALAFSAVVNTLGLPMLLKELILATNPTVEGEATAHYISDMAARHKVLATRIAHGVPLGGELEYIDAGTLAHAFSGRQRFDS